MNPAFTLVTQQATRTAMKEQWEEMALDYGAGPWIEVMEPLVEDMIERYLNRPITYKAGAVEYLSSSDDNKIALSRTPVISVAEVRVDARGGFGQLTGTFDDDTILEAGTYFLELDGEGDYQGQSESGILYRDRSNWGYARSWKADLLAAARVQTRGNIKVTYTGGYTSTTLPATLRQAIFLTLARIWQFTIQPVMINFESWYGYSYSHTLSFDMKDPIFTDVRRNLNKFMRYRMGVTRG